MMKNAQSVFVFLLIALAFPAHAETVEQLKAQLDAKEQIIQLQRQRIDTLEAQIEGRKIQPPVRTEVNPDVAANDPESNRALERTLERRGSAVLAPYVVELTPSLLWRHSRNDLLSSSDDLYGAGFDARIGLPNGWMLGAGIPYLNRDIDSLSDNSGIGDLSATVWKSIVSESDTKPSLVASLRYSSPTGEDVGDNLVSLGSGFHQIAARLSTVKTFDPIAFFGDLSYSHYLEESISGLDVDRSDAIGFGLGATLAVTPDISLSTSLDFAYEDEIVIDGLVVDGSNTTLGLFEIGAGVVLNKNVFLNVFGAFGVTDDSPDTILGFSLPIRF